MKIDWEIENEDIQRIKEFVDSRMNRSFVKNRIARNVDGPVPAFNREVFWNWMILCLLTTQQRSGPDSSVTRFTFIKPFPLSLRECREQANLSEFVEHIITDFGGLRRARTIGAQVASNLKWLDEIGWPEIENSANELTDCRRRKPQLDDRIIERNAAKVVMDGLKGFGPKQSRNLWQTLGLTRFEIPADSRIIKWFNRFGFPLKLSASALSDTHYYNFVMDGIQEVCDASNVYPCVLDAAIFADFDPEWPENKLIW